MAERKVSGNDVLLFIGTDGITYDTIVCLTSNGITRATGEIEANTKCGPDKLPGTQTNSVSFEGQILVEPSAGKASTDQLDDYWRNTTTIYWKMGKVNPGIGDVTYYGTGYISKLDENYAQDSSGTFTGTIAPYGIINKTTATS